MNATLRTFDPQSKAVQQTQQLLSTPWKLRFFYWKRLPTLAWWSVRVVDCKPERAAVRIPFSWRTQNPFGSIYFAALLGAAELSTGVLALMARAGRGKIAMLVTGIEEEFTKKAKAATTFYCEEGQMILDAVQRSIDSLEGETVTVETVGRMEDGTEVARMRITWSFKAK